MNMNKKIIYCLLCIFLCVLSVNVFASDCNNFGCATCVYENNTWKFTYDLKSDGNGSAELNFDPKAKGFDSPAAAPYAPKLSSKLVAANFIKKDTNKLFCPSQLYILYEGASGEVFGEPKEISMTKKTVAVSLVDYESKNNNLSTLKEGAQKGIPCSRPCPMITGSGSVKVTITPIGEELKYELSDGFKINLNHNNHDLTVEAFKDKCPKFYCQCGSSGENKYCSVSLNHHFDIFDRDEAQQSYEEQEAGKNTDHNSQVDTNVTLDDTIVGDGFCEEDSTRRVLSLVGIILMIAKVLVPLIIILIGSIDLFKAVMSKDEKDLMKSVKSIGLRLLVGIFIFFVPTIVDVVIDLVRDGHNENQCVECVLNPLDCRE